MAADYNVYLPDQQTCCGAMDRHDGDLKTAAQLAEMNCQAFAEPDLLAIVTIASGCGSQLKEYENTEFACKVVDISQFLIRSGSNFTDRLRPLAASVCLHTPCSLKNVMREEQGSLQLLRQIPGLTLAQMPETVQCCGAAGTYMLDHADMAKALADDALGFASETDIRYLATSNIGCALHLTAGIRDRGMNMEVIHPVTLLARQLLPKSESGVAGRL